MRSCISVILSLLLLGWQPLAADAVRPSILVLGDSLSAAYGITEEESWVSLMRDRLAAKGYGYTILNASISGDTTSGGLLRLNRALEQHRPAIVILELGGNDALRGSPLPVIRRNLAEMITRSKAAGARVILAGMQIPPNYGSTYANGFAQIYRDLAREHAVALIDFFLEGVALEPALMQADGIHPTAEAQPILLDNVWAVLGPKLAAAERSRTGHAGQPAAALP